MAGDRTVSLIEGRPEAGSATSPAEFVAAMRQLKSWSGLSYRQLETRAARCGAVLPRSTLMNALCRETLPREDLVTAFARACGCGEDETAGWVVARRRLATVAASARSAVAGPDARRAAVRETLMVLALAAVLVTTMALTWLVAV